MSAKPVTKRKPRSKVAKKSEKRPGPARRSIEEQVDEIFERDYAKTWAKRLAESPHARAQLRELLRVELELDIIAQEVDEHYMAGGASMEVAPNGVKGKHPLLVHQKELRQSQKNLCLSLHLDLARRDRNKSKETGFSAIRKSRMKKK